MRDALPFREKTSSLHDARHTLLVTFAETVLISYPDLPRPRETFQCKTE